MARKSLTLTILELPEGGYVICHGDANDEFPIRAAETVQAAGYFVREKVIDTFTEPTVNQFEPTEFPTVLKPEPRRGLLWMIKGGRR